VVLITQRSQVQILPPLLILQVRGLFRLWEGPSCCGLCTGDREQALSASVWMAVTGTSRHDLRLCGTRRDDTAGVSGCLAQRLQADSVRTPRRPTPCGERRRPVWLAHKAHGVLIAVGGG